MPAHDPQPIWPDGYSRATLTAYPCPGGAGACVMVLPGGGYQRHAAHEGEAVARRCNAAGFHAAVLHYSVAPAYRHPVMVHDAQRAARLLRANGKHWGVEATKLAALGFSAGGHLAATLAVHPDRFTRDHDDLAGRVPAELDAVVLCYAVMDLCDPANAHTGSRNHLVGPDPDPATLQLLSPSRHVTPRTPPAFLWHTRDDASVPVANSVAFAQACHAHGVPYELHVYESGKHGLGLATDHPPVDSWFDLAMSFLKRNVS